MSYPRAVPEVPKVVRREALEIPRVKRARRVRVGPDDEGGRERRRDWTGDLQEPSDLKCRMSSAQSGCRRCHGEDGMSRCPYGSKSTQDPSVRRTSPPVRVMLREPGWSDDNRLGVSVLDTLPPCPETECSQGSRGQSRPPKALRVFHVERGNPDTSAWSAKPGETTARG